LDLNDFLTRFTPFTVIEKPVNLGCRSGLTKHLVDPETTTDDG